MALRYSRIAVELREVELRDKPVEMIAASPKGTVPVLVLPDGAVIDESLDIMLWSLRQYDPDDWLEDYGPDAESLIARNDEEFKVCLDRYKYAEHFPERTAVDYRTECEKFLKELEGRLQRHAYLMGARRSIADAALGPFVRQFAHVDLAWFESSDFAALREWLDDLKSSALFQSVMQKYPVWRQGNAPQVFG